VITAYEGKGVQRMAYEMGVTVYLQKPICIDELRELIHRMISLKEKLEEDKKWSEF
jgi:CheY-like chemotaxis protein